MGSSLIRAGLGNPEKDTSLLKLVLILVIICVNTFGLPTTHGCLKGTIIDSILRLRSYFVPNSLCSIYSLLLTVDVYTLSPSSVDRSFTFRVENRTIHIFTIRGLSHKLSMSGRYPEVVLLLYSFAY